MCQALGSGRTVGRNGGCDAGGQGGQALSTHRPAWPTTWPFAGVGATVLTWGCDEALTVPRSRGLLLTLGRLAHPPRKWPPAQWWGTPAGLSPHPTLQARLAGAGVPDAPSPWCGCGGQPEPSSLPWGQAAGATEPRTKRLSNFFASVMWIQLSFSTTLMCFTSSLNLGERHGPQQPPSPRSGLVTAVREHGPGPSSQPRLPRARPFNLRPTGPSPHPSRADPHCLPIHLWVPLAGLEPKLPVSL